jgi:hypothetical protein
MAIANWDSHEGAQRLIPLLNSEIEKEFQSLLETKHLYQKVTVDWERIVQALRQQIVSSYHSEFQQLIRDVPNMPFAPVTQVRRVQSQGALGSIPLVLLLKNVTMFCRECDRREAFRPILYKDLAVELSQLPPSGLVRRLPAKGNFQDFVLVYQCQRCEGAPETVIVRRNFTEAQEKIEKHFEIRKAMSIPETPAKPPKPSTQ